MTQSIQDEVTRLFNRAADAYTFTGLRPDEETILRTVFPPPPARILVGGCGAGRTIIPLCTLGYQVSGIDIAPAMIEGAQQQVHDAKLAAELIVGDAAQLDVSFAGRQFDVIWFPFHALDYVIPHAHRKDALRASAELLHPNGAFIFNSHNLLFPRTLRQHLLHHHDGLTLIQSKEGDLWTQTVLPWSAGKDAADYFASITRLPRYQLIPSKKGMSWKEHLARALPWLDKSIYVIAKNPISPTKQHT